MGHYHKARDLLAADEGATACVVLEVTTTPEIHRQLELVAKAKGVTIDDMIQAAIKQIILKHAMRQDVLQALAEMEENPPELTPEDREWLDAPPVGRELI